MLTIDMHPLTPCMYAWRFSDLIGVPIHENEPNDELNSLMIQSTSTSSKRQSLFELFDFD